MQRYKLYTYANEPIFRSMLPIFPLFSLGKRDVLLYILWRKSKMFRYIAAEVRKAVKVQFVGNFFSREFAVHQQMPDFHYRKLLNPVAGGASAYLGGYLMQMLGRDAKRLGIIGYRTVLTVAAPLQHLNEA